MAALHAALQSLGPSDFSSVPTEQSQTRDYLQNLFTQAQVIIDSIPPPAAIPTASAPTPPNSTTSPVTGAADLSASSARSEPIDPANISLQKEWSKPIKLGAKENPLGMSVYRMGGKDGRGAWFARRSVHEGLGFRKWKLGLQREFPETMEVQGGPGEGNIRGIGGERRVEKIVIDGVGTIEGEFHNRGVGKDVAERAWQADRLKYTTCLLNFPARQRREISSPYWSPLRPRLMDPRNHRGWNLLQQCLNVI